MDNNFIIDPNGSSNSNNPLLSGATNPMNAQNLANELFKKFPNMTPKNPADTALNTDIKEEVKEDFAKAQSVALSTEAGKQALKEFEEAKKKLVDEMIVQLPKGAEALKAYRDKVMSIYKENEALKVEQATKATDELNAKYKALQTENDAIKAKLDEVLKRLDTPKPVSASSVFSSKNN